MTTIFGSEVHRLKADVVVIGGGTAGLNTALAAAEMGADVLVVDKAHIQRSGAIAGGIDHFFAYLDTGPAWDTRDAYLGWVARVARGASNIKIHEKVYCDELVPAMERIESMGVSLRQPDGKILRTQALGQPGPIAINFDGKLLKPKMAFQIKKKHIRTINRVQVSNLYLHNGELAGLAGYDVRTGDFYEIQAKAAVVSTGNTNRMFKSQTGNPFNLWYCPANTGDLHRAAFDVGVELANVEYIRLTIVPKGFSAPGFNAFFGMGGKFVNGLGQDIYECLPSDGRQGPAQHDGVGRAAGSARRPRADLCRRAASLGQGSCPPVLAAWHRQGHVARISQGQRLRPRGRPD